MQGGGRGKLCTKLSSGFLRKWCKYMSTSNTLGRRRVWHDLKVFFSLRATCPQSWPLGNGATVAEQLVSLLASHQGDPGSIPAQVTPDFRTWESCRTMPLIGEFSRGSPVPPPFHSGAALYSPQSPSSAFKTSMLRAVQISPLASISPDDQRIAFLSKGTLKKEENAYPDAQQNCSVTGRDCVLSNVHYHSPSRATCRFTAACGPIMVVAAVGAALRTSYFERFRTLKTAVATERLIRSERPWCQFVRKKKGEKDTSDINNMNSARQDKCNCVRMTQLPQSIPGLYEEEVDNSTQQRNTGVAIASSSHATSCDEIKTKQRHNQLKCKTKEQTRRVVTSAGADVMGCSCRFTDALRELNSIDRTLNFTVLYALQTASFPHWLLHRCEDTPSLAEQHIPPERNVLALYSPGTMHSHQSTPRTNTRLPSSDLSDNKRVKT
ncbi:hypothetical protein PR048_012056 [Dryococelus australis]|uniref:Transmembrane protein n=1 Tax=Dryococelus australis TaxID=614101 RepID=A0ABQ9HNU7_9NEOP|nr:hypothetical protein PR048_012056 [Dryococelus australis]